MERSLEMERIATGESLMDVAMGATKRDTRGYYGRNTRNTRKSLTDDDTERETTTLHAPNTARGALYIRASSPNEL